jgi:lipopolysaccharide transport system ATP-binding protein
LCTKGVVLDDGKLVFQGTQTQALDYYVQSIQTRKTLLADRKDRRGTGTLRVHDVTFRRDGNASNVLTAGGEIEILLHFKQVELRVYNGLKVEIRITTLFDAPVFTQHNHLSGVDFSSLPARGAFVCRISKFPLPSGVYRLTYLIRSNMDYEMVDTVEGACDIHVEGGRFFPSGELPDSHLGVALVNAAWELEN